MNKKFPRKGIVLTEFSLIKDKKEFATPTSTKKFPPELLSRGVKHRCNLYYNPVLTSRSPRQMAAETRVSRAEFPEVGNSRENSISFAEPKKKAKKRFFFLPTAGMPRKVRLKKPNKPAKNNVQQIDMAQTIVRDSVALNEVTAIEFKAGFDEPPEENSSEETPKFKCKADTNPITLKLKECISREELAKSSFTCAFNSIHNAHSPNANDSNQLIAKVNFRRRSRLLKATSRKTQAQKAAPAKESNLPQGHILIHRKIPVSYTHLTLPTICSV
eukprot:TRINITY_DN3582_c0_g2_i2.p1 TRINITY_DN3582_c0_g2~~TRINITY_DN3582_c0_g2_i2.p1  ORF type:complete len:273 (+),score=79.76 TRINITY_DN3582_c0_g2_i2:263-1081(+)